MCMILYVHFEVVLLMLTCVTPNSCSSIKDITRDHVSVIGANGLLCKL